MRRREPHIRRAMGFWLLAAVGLAPLTSPAQPDRPADPTQTPAAKALSASEREWILQNPVVRFTFDPDWPPYGFLDSEGGASGIDAQLVPEVLRTVGLKCVFVPATSWSHAQELLETGRVDMISGVARTAKREQRWGFTSAYLNFPVAIVSRDDGPFVTTLRSLVGRKVALPEGHATADYILSRYPGVELTLTPSAEEALRLVAIQRCDFTVENLLTADHIIHTRGLANLKISGLIEETFALRLMLPTDDTPLREILDKAIRKLSPKTRSDIVAQWISHDIRGLTFLRKVTPWLLALAGALAGAFLLMLILNRRMKREVTLRRNAEAALERSNQELTWLMNVAAHDLRSPLNAIMMATDLLDQSLSANRNTASAPGPDALLSIREGALRMRRLIENLLDLRAMEEGRLEIEIEDVDLLPLLEDVVTLYRPVALQNGIHLRIAPDATPVTARCSTDALRQVLENLVGNALKYSPPESEVLLSVERRDDRVFCEVADTGPGISSEDREHIFEHFRRGRSRAQGRESSHGLGLAISKVLIEAQNGEIWCHSEPGKGSRFGFSLRAA